MQGGVPAPARAKNTGKLACALGGRPDLADPIIQAAPPPLLIIKPLYVERAQRFGHLDSTGRSASLSLATKYKLRMVHDAGAFARVGSLVIQVKGNVDAKTAPCRNTSLVRRRLPLTQRL
jgi:hypothetical protein